MTPANFVAYAAQVTIVVLACAGLPRLVGLRAPGPQYAFWRLVLAVCILLPLVQPWQPGVMEFVPGPPLDAALQAAPPAPPGPPPAPVTARFDWMAAARLVVLMGIAIRLAWIGLGMVRLRGMRRRATDQALGFGDLQQAIGAPGPILWSSEVRHPVTFGLIEPVVLLPMALKAADLQAQRAVVAHELHHVKRGDWGWIVAEELIRSVFWFHPAVWWLVSRVQLARETVVDELSILATNARRTYLDTLLAFADDTGLTSSPAFSARRHLFHRVMLLSKEGQMSSRRVAFASCVLVLALGLGTWEAVNAFPLYGTAAQDQRPPRDPLTPEAHHRLAQQDGQKANADTTLTPEQKLDTIAKGIAAEERALGMNPDYVPSIAYKSIFLRMQANLTADPEQQKVLLRQADELNEKAKALRPAAPASNMPAPSGNMTFVAAPPPPPEFQALLDQLKPMRISGDIKVPVKVKDVKPDYPPIAQSARVQGVVIVEAIIGADGNIAGSRVLRSIPLLDEAALASVNQWRFMPTLMNGEPVPMLMTVTVNFALK
jgi:TonB family protein